MIETHDRREDQAWRESTCIHPGDLDGYLTRWRRAMPGSMGMGLSICRSILQSHGGRLWATAKGGSGTIFSFTLPKFDEEEAATGVKGA